ncbi:MAG: hypothetical protein M0T71_00130 [Actinomycetota bacterium]|nr:hypothetical protein [Actinomycetota bacterium]
MVSLRALTRPADLAAGDARLPGLALRAVLLAVGIGLAIVEEGGSGLLVVAIALAIGAAWAPQYLLGWGLILCLGLSQLARHDVLGWRLLVLLAGLHLLHVLSLLVLELPWRSWIQPSVLAGPLVRFVAVQLPAQALAIPTLALLAPGGGGHRPVTMAAFAGVGIVALAGLTALLLLPPPADIADAPGARPGSDAGEG